MSVAAGTPAGESQLPFVSVVMPIRNEADFIERSLTAVMVQDYPHDRLEIIVADGCSDDGTVERVRASAATDPRIRVLNNAGRIVATGLNQALTVARGEIIVRIDGHCEIAPDYVSRCVAHLLADEADGVGGSLETVGATGVSRAIAVAMSSPFGVGNSAFRTVSGRSMLVDTVAFGAYRRGILDRAGPFDVELVRNQDDEYNYRLRKMGGRLLLAQDVRARYHSRSSLRSLWRQYFQYGYWKVRVLQKHPRQMSARQFAPPAFVGALLAGVLLLPWPPSRLPFALLIATYAVAATVATFVSAKRAGAGTVYLPLAFAILHLSYGSGFLKGLIAFRRRWHSPDVREQGLGTTA